MNVAGKKVVVFGGFGFIGLNLLKRLLDEKADVTVLDTAESPPLRTLTDKIKHFQGDIRDSELVGQVLLGQEVLFNLAGKSGSGNSMKDPKLDLEVNCLGVLNILEKAKEVNPDLKIVFPGSRLEFGKPLTLPVNEDHPMRPTSIYGIHKLTAEKYHLAYFDNFGLRSTVLRISNPYGPHLAVNNPGYNIINYFVDQAGSEATLKIFGEGDQKRDYLYVGDLVDLFLQVADEKKSDGQVYNIGSGVGVSLLKMAQTIVEVVGKGKIEKVPWDSKLLRLETGDYVSDLTKIKSEVGWVPKNTVREGLLQTLKESQTSYWKS